MIGNEVAMSAEQCAVGKAKTCSNDSSCILIGEKTVHETVQTHTM